MRLPSHNYDTRDLIRSISGGTEGPEEIVEAEDYLQPTSTEDDVLSEQEPLSPLQDYKVKIHFVCLHHVRSCKLCTCSFTQCPSVCSKLAITFTCTVLILCVCIYMEVPACP